MRILVAGGAGFLGSHLCRYLLEAGYEVVCLDNNLTSSLSNVDSLLLNRNFTFINHDVKSPIEIKVDGIFNLACPASPKHYQTNPIDTFLTSILGARNLLELALKNSCAVLQVSTSEVYGDPQISPQHEDYWGNVNPFGIRSCYDEGKRGAETLFHDYNQILGANTRIARVFNTYGPNMAIDDGRVVSNFIVQALTNLPLTVFGDGSQVRSFCYVSDLIDGLVKLFFAENVHQPINLGNPDSVSIIELAKQIIQLTSSQSSIHFENLPQDDPVTRIPNAEKAKNLLGWEPNVNRLVGLKSTINYFKDELHRNIPRE